MTPTIYPLPLHVGSGFTCIEPLDLPGYTHRLDGRYHNYFFTPENVRWPEAHKSRPQEARIDGFSPNLNKSLHVGHLRNLALGASLVQITGTPLKPVAMLGTSLGENPGAREELFRWYELACYLPNIHEDLELPAPMATLADGVGAQAGCKVWAGPQGPVIVQRADGRSTYAMHELAFADAVQPTHYVTGIEQKQHFESLGLGDKHVGMGLLTDTLGSKLRSRTGDALSAREAMDLIAGALTGPTPHLTWNVAAWSLLSAKRTANLKFLPESWANANAGGLYVTYTFARTRSALQAAGVRESTPRAYDAEDVPLAALAEYFHPVLRQARLDMDPCPLAQYALTLSRMLSSALEKHRVVEGRPSFQQALWAAGCALGKTMRLLTMRHIERV